MTVLLLSFAGRDDPFHLPSLERPEEFNAVVAEFLARV